MTPSDDRGVLRADRHHRDRGSRRPQLPGLRRGDRRRDRPAARHRPRPGSGGHARRRRHHRARDAPAQRLRHRRARAGPHRRWAVRRAGRGRRPLRAPPRPRRRGRRSRADALPRPAHPGAHAPPRQLRAERRRRRGAGGVHRRLDALRGDRADRPARPGAHADARARAVPLGAPARPRAAAGDAGVPHPRVRQLLLRDADQRHRVDRRGAGPRQSRAHAGRAVLRRRADRRAGRLSRLLRAHGAGQRGGPGAGRPLPAAARGRRGARRAGSRPGSGSWTSAPGGRSPRATCRAR